MWKYLPYVSFVKTQEADFMRLKFFPDSISADDQHYKSFEQVWGCTTDESHMPYLLTKKSCGQGIPFNPLQQHAKITRLFLTCVECKKPRLFYSKSKLSPQEHNDVLYVTNDLLYTCAAVFEDFKTNDNNKKGCVLDKVFI